MSTRTQGGNIAQVPRFPRYVCGGSPCWQTLPNDALPVGACVLWNYLTLCKPRRGVLSSELDATAIVQIRDEEEEGPGLLRRQRGGGRGGRGGRRRKDGMMEVKHRAAAAVAVYKSRRDDGKEGQTM